MRRPLILLFGLSVSVLTVIAQDIIEQPLLNPGEDLQRYSSEQLRQLKSDLEVQISNLRAEREQADDWIARVGGEGGWINVYTRQLEELRARSERWLRRDRPDLLQRFNNEDTIRQTIMARRFDRDRQMFQEGNQTVRTDLRDIGDFNNLAEWQQRLEEFKTQLSRSNALADDGRWNATLRAFSLVESTIDQALNAALEEEGTLELTSVLAMMDRIRSDLQAGSANAKQRADDIDKEIRALKDEGETTRTLMIAVEEYIGSLGDKWSPLPDALAVELDRLEARTDIDSQLAAHRYRMLVDYIVRAEETQIGSFLQQHLSSGAVPTDQQVADFASEKRSYSRAADKRDPPGGSFLTDYLTFLRSDEPKVSQYIASLELLAVENSTEATNK